MVSESFYRETFKLWADAEIQVTIEYIRADNGEVTTKEYTVGPDGKETYVDLAAPKMIIKVYGDGITMVDLQVMNLTSLDVTNCTSLTELYCERNKLTALDLTKNTSLEVLTCYENQITALDLSKNEMLTMLNCTDNQINTLDVTKCTSLVGLLCNNNKLITIDLSALMVLKTLYCNDNQLTELILPESNVITALNCENNQLTSLNVSSFVNLGGFSCKNNKLKSLDVSKNMAMTYFICSENQLSLSEIPAKKAEWTTYEYAPQQPVEITNDSNAGVDLSSEMSIGGQTTVCIWKTVDGTVLELDGDYTITNGVTRFLKSQPEPVYCEMTNASLPDLSGDNILKTTSVDVPFATTIDNATMQAIQVYVQGQRLFASLERAAQLSVFDISGREVLTTSVHAGQNILELSDKGIFIVRIVENGRAFTQKVMVK